jgi:2-polyprenyl-3-methyl-5-hydroxy-6-metoxy-1,4-benzoquinol methylase
VSTVLTQNALVVDRTWSAQEIDAYQAAIAAAAGPSGYYHRYVIHDRAGQVLTTPGPHPCIQVLASLDRFGFPGDFTGKRVLDIGCNAGFYSFAARLRGARSVLGLDYFQHCVDQSKIFRDILQLDVEFRQADGENLVPEDLGAFDFVINTGVLYHLQNPMRFLSNAARLTSGCMFLETEMLTDPKLTDYAWFIEKTYGGDGSNWWLYGPECVVRMARAAGFARAEFKGFVWKPSWAERKTPEGFRRQGRGVVMCWK